VKSLATWVPCHTDLPGHPKTVKLARLLKVSIPTAVGHLVMLWMWALQYSADGSLEGYEAEDISAAAGYAGKAEVFITALRNCGVNRPGYLDGPDISRLEVHDFDVYLGPVNSKRKSDAERKREARKLKAAKEAGLTSSVLRTEADASGGRPADVPRMSRVEESRGEERRVEEIPDIGRPADVTRTDTRTTDADADEKAGPAKAPKGPTPDDLAKVWNENRGEVLPAVRLPLGKNRLAHARARLKETPSLEEHAAAIRRIAVSPWCTGTHERSDGWVADLDWYLKPETYARILEGKYDARSAAPRAGSGVGTQKPNLRDYDKAPDWHRRVSAATQDPALFDRVPSRIVGEWGSWANGDDPTPERVAEILAELDAAEVPR